MVKSKLKHELDVFRRLSLDLHFEYTFKLGGHVTCGRESSDSTVPDCGGATSTRTQILVL